MLLKLRWETIPSSAFMTNPLPHHMVPFPANNNHFLQLTLHCHSHTCSCRSIITECRFPGAGGGEDGKITQGVYQLETLCLPQRLLCVHSSFFGDESQHLPARRDPEDNLDNSYRNGSPERQSYSRLQSQEGIKSIPWLLLQPCLTCSLVFPSLLFFLI